MSKAWFGGFAWRRIALLGGLLLLLSGCHYHHQGYRYHGGHHGGYHGGWERGHHGGGHHYKRGRGHHRGGQHHGGWRGRH